NTHNMNESNLHFIGHHGDIGLWQSDSLPKDVKLIKNHDNILHRGEGIHAHTFDMSSDVEIYEDKDGNRWFVVGENGATITHEEHKIEVFNPNTIIKTIIERKRNPYTGMIDQVVD
ncbi:MAG: hypothetical protein NUV65_06455, partial [Candidatus Roizmanbacteria bacterium]|nr:hypothetical protein [Candidatus Roizmanbacteria bacterium]